MKFLIFEARKENEELYLSGYFQPNKDCESESYVIKKMINIFQEGAVAKPDFVKIKDRNKSKDNSEDKTLAFYNAMPYQLAESIKLMDDKTLAFYSATPYQLAEALKLMSDNSDLTVKPVINIRYSGTNEKEVTDTLKKVTEGWSKITIVESK